MRIPKRFVSAHSHTGFSPFDGLGFPNEHFEFAERNGLDGMGITEHGQFNSYCHAQLFIEEWQKKGKQFKYLPGIEAYFHPDLQQWARDKALNEELAADAKLAEKERKKALASIETVVTRQTDGEDETIGVETNNALTLENEEESKSAKHFSPVNRRHHLVLLPRNEQGLQQLFHLTSRSYMEGFYRFPRIDLRMIKEVVTKGNVVAQSACIGGLPAFNIFRTLEKVRFDDMTPALLDDPSIMEQCVTAVGNAYDMMVDAFGAEWFYLELQFNRLPAQDLVNRAMIEFARRNGVTDRLTAAADSHYYNPDVWKEREIYKKLAYLNYTSYDPNALPKSKDELKCELYPKNAGQMWDEYLKAKERHPFYDAAHDDVVCDAIERSWSIAHEVIGDIKPDRTIKLPKRTPEGKTSIRYLTELCVAGMKKRGLYEGVEYKERLKEELQVIDHLGMADYFITLARILELGREVALIGPGRGSGAGSLVNYVLYITDLDPIRWDLPFARFLSVYRQGMADVDTDVSDRDSILDVMRAEFGFENVVPISNYNTTKLKSLTKDIAKFYGIDFQEANQATQTVETEVRKAITKEGDDKNLFQLIYDDAMSFHCVKSKEPNARPICAGCTDECKRPVSPSYRGFIERHPQVGESIKVLFRQNRSLGRHAGGVLVCDDLPKKMPLITSKGEPQSPWVEGVQYKHLEKIGSFVKFDVLGLATLRFIERTIYQILKRKEGIANPTFKDVRRWFDEHMLVDKIDLNDQRVYKHVYEEARWAGVFQCVDKASQVSMSDGSTRAICDVKEGDRVMTWNEEQRCFTDKRVINVFDQGAKECVELTFDSGKTLVCTVDHPVRTNRGWVPAGDLTEDDEITEFTC